MGARICVRRLRRERPVTVADEEAVGVDEGFGAEGLGEGVRVRMVRRREIGVKVRWAERVEGRGGVKI